MFTKMMSNITIAYRNESFFIQKKAKALYFFCLITALVMIMLFFATLLFEREKVIQSGAVVTVILIGCITAFLILTVS